MNETQFNLIFDNSWLYKGRFWRAPQVTTYAFNHSAFSACNSPGIRLKPGISGAAVFHIDIAGEELPISIAFSNPFNFWSPPKTRAEFTANMKTVWDRMVDDSPYTELKNIGVCETNKSKKVNVTFSLTSAPGKLSKVTIAQIAQDV